MKTTRSSVYSKLVDEIVSGTIEPGEALVENSLASRLGVSRSPIREALRWLESDGLVERYQRGLRVRRRTAEEVLQMYDVRIVLEALAARTAALQRTELDLIRLRGQLEAFAASRDTNVDIQISAFRAIRNMIWKASHNDPLIEMLQRLITMLHYENTTLRSSPVRFDQVLAEQTALIEAITAHQPDQAEKIAREAMIVTRNIRLQMLTQRTE